MSASQRSRWRSIVRAGFGRFFQRGALPVVVVLSTSSGVCAQTPRAASRDLDAVLAPGRTVWVTTSGGSEEKMRVVEVSGDFVSVSAGGAVKPLPIAEVQRVRVRDSDPVWNGALIGAGAAIASGLLLCRATEPWQNCRDDVGPMLRIGALGAGIGIGIDALIRRRQTVYEAPPGSTRMEASPVLGPRVAGVQLSVAF